MIKDPVTNKEAQQILGRKHDMVRRYVRAYKLTAERQPGGAMLYSRKEIEALKPVLGSLGGDEKPRTRADRIAMCRPWTPEGLRDLSGSA